MAANSVASVEFAIKRRPAQTAAACAACRARKRIPNTTVFPHMRTRQAQRSAVGPDASALRCAPNAVRRQATRALRLNETRAPSSGTLSCRAIHGAARVPEPSRPCGISSTDSVIVGIDFCLPCWIVHLMLRCIREGEGSLPQVKSLRKRAYTAEPGGRTAAWRGVGTDSTHRPGRQRTPSSRPDSA